MHRSNTALKAIVGMGVVAFLFLFASSLGLKSALRPDEKERVSGRRSESPFEGERAMASLKAILAAGPRAPGAPGHDAARVAISGEAVAAGLRVREFAVPKAGVTHLVGELKGRKPGALLLMAHYDCVAGRGPGYVGANDGAAASAFLLALARSMQSGGFSRTVLFAWLDGAAGTDAQAATAAEGLLDALKGDVTFPKVDAALYFEGIGDCYLRVATDPAAAKWIKGIVDDVVVSMNLGAHFGGSSVSPFAVSGALNARGVPTMSFVDTLYGGSLVEHAKNWHTGEDTPEKICPDSLKAIGDVIYHALPAIDGHLDAMGSNTP